MKRITLFLFFSIVSITAFSQTKISGVITYYFNEYQGNKPDIGASVILIDSTESADFDYGLYEKFHYGKFYNDMYLSAVERYEKYASAHDKFKKGKKYDADRERMKKGMADAQKDMDKYVKEMARFETETPEKLAKAGADLYMQLLQLDEDLPKRTVNSNGNYSMEIKPGVYYVYIKSNNREGIILPETDGKIYIKKIRMTENADKDVSYNFELL